MLVSARRFVPPRVLRKERPKYRVGAQRTVSTGWPQLPWGWSLLCAGGCDSLGGADLLTLRGPWQHPAAGPSPVAHRELGAPRRCNGQQPPRQASEGREEDSNSSINLSDDCNSLRDGTRKGRRVPCPQKHGSSDHARNIANCATAPRCPDHSLTHLTHQLLCPIRQAGHNLCNRSPAPADKSRSRAAASFSPSFALLLRSALIWPHLVSEGASHVGPGSIRAAPDCQPVP